VRPGQTTKTLAEAITRKQGGSINTLRCILLTCLDVAEGLKFMHRVRTLHGDLKPHNILLVSDKNVRSSAASRAARYLAYVFARSRRRCAQEGAPQRLCHAFVRVREVASCTGEHE
jgi:serine/threonine protein kinase